MLHLYCLKRMEKPRLKDPEWSPQFLILDTPVTISFFRIYCLCPSTAF